MFHSFPRPVLVFLLANLYLNLVNAASYEISKVVMTGDGVPGFTQPEVTETFRFFRSVHMFPDGTIAFAGITTRGEFTQRDIARGIYYSGAPGALVTVAEMEDAEGWRPIGLPQNILDSNSSKSFAYDFLLSLESGFQNVYAIQPFDGDQVPLTPTDDSEALISSHVLGENELYRGRFSSDLSGMAINEAGQVVFASSFFLGDDEFATQGLFSGSEESGVRNIAFVGDPVPGIENATFASFTFVSIAEDGTALFSARLEGEGAPPEANDAVMMEKDGTFTVVLREGDPAPGFPEFLINLIGGVNILYLDTSPDWTLLATGIAQPGDQAARGYWLGTPGSTELTPFLHLDSSPNLNDPIVYTATDQGSIAFISIDNNSIQLGPDGDIYFDAGGRFADESTIGGVWKRSIADGSVSLLMRNDSVNGLWNYDILDVMKNGNVVFLAEKNNVEGLWVRNATGELTNVLNVGDSAGRAGNYQFPRLIHRWSGSERKDLGASQISRFDRRAGQLCLCRPV